MDYVLRLIYKFYISLKLVSTVLIFNGRYSKIHLTLRTPDFIIHNSFEKVNAFNKKLGLCL